MTTAPELSPELLLLRSLTHLMARWSAGSTQESVAASAGVSLETTDIRPLYMLGLAGPTRAADLASVLHLSRPTMSKQIARLERAGLITRTPDPDDGRAAIIALSAEGAHTHSLLVREGRRMIEAALSDWSAAEQAAFAQQLSRFTAGLGVKDSTDEPAVDVERS